MRLSGAIFSSVCLCAAAAADAAEWSASPVLSCALDHDTNRRLGPDAQASQAARLEGALLLRRSSPSSSISLKSEAGWQEYSQDVAQNARNFAFTGASLLIWERAQLNAQASVSRDDTLNSELADTGTFTGSTERNAKSALISWRYTQSDRRVLDVLLSYSDLEYENLQFYDFFGTPIPLHSQFGYRYPSIAVTERLQWTQRSSFQISGHANRLISQTPGNDSNTQGISLGLTHALTPHIEVTLNGGLSRQVRDGDANTGYTGRFELAAKQLLGQWSLSVQRSAEPSAYGYLVTRTDAAVSLNRRLTPRWSGWVAAHGLWNESAEDLRQIGEHRRYDRTEAGATWDATRTWRLSATAAYSQVQFGPGAPLTHASRFTLGATWTPRPSRMSR